MPAFIEIVEDFLVALHLVLLPGLFGSDGAMSQQGAWLDCMCAVGKGVTCLETAGVVVREACVGGGGEGDQHQEGGQEEEGKSARAQEEHGGKSGWGGTTSGEEEEDRGDARWEMGENRRGGEEADGVGRTRRPKGAAVYV